MGTAAGIVVAAAVPVGVLAWIWARRAGQPLFPRWRPPVPRWTGPEVIVLFLTFQALTALAVQVLTVVEFYPAVLPPSRTSADQVTAFVAVAGGAAALDHQAVPTRVRKAMWAGFLAVPLLLMAARVLRSAVGRNDPPPTPSDRTAADVALGVLAWVVLTPVVFAVYILAQAVVLSPGERPDTHPLVLLGPADRPIDLAVFLLSTCVFVPLGEEFVFRGLLIPWATRARYGPAVLFAAALLFAVWGSSSAAEVRLAPLAFLAVLGVGLILVYRLCYSRGYPVRTVAAIYSSAAFFAAVHSGVWPTPVPLFVLGLGLGYLVARTRRLLPAVIVHGLFNAVSSVLVLSGGAVD